MIDLGSTVPLSVAITDANNNPVNATGVTLTITRPDGTTATPTPTNPDVGSYVYQFVTTQPGHHQVRWTSTDPATSYTDIFYVEDTAPTYLISLDEAKAALARNPRAVAGIKDDDLRFYVAAVTPIVEAIVGPRVVKTKTYTTDGGRWSILLPAAPVALTTLTENGVTLHEGPDFTVDYAAGIIYRGSSLMPYPFYGGRDNIVVTYTVGNGVLSENIRLGVRIILRHLWQADQQGNRPALGSTDSTNNDLVTVQGGYAIPRRAEQLLAPSGVTDMPGFA